MQDSQTLQDKFSIYKQLLLKWQKAINLVSPATLTDVDTRHFLDSQQLNDIIPHGTDTISDIGSGAGFPGLILAMLNPDIAVTLIESDQRKCEFLKTVSRETDTTVTVINDRIENAFPTIRSDLITARALGTIKMIFDVTAPHANQTYLLPKGKTADEEIVEALQHYTFQHTATPSKTETDAKILLITQVKPI